MTAEAHVETERASRYLVQLCRHVSRIPTHSGDAPARREVQPHVEWSDTHGIITLAPWGQCTMQASADMLTLRVQATDEDHLRRIQGLIAERRISAAPQKFVGGWSRRDSAGPLRWWPAPRATTRTPSGPVSGCSALAAPDHLTTRHNAPSLITPPRLRGRPTGGTSRVMIAVSVR
ncbi:MAG: DUF2218 domain-containing protein [Pseudonocardiaceae bacterium]